MIALLIGGTVVFCIGLLTVVFGIPIKEFSFGSTMILAGSIVACTGLVLIGLYAVGRELRSLTRRLETGLPVAAVPAVLPPEPEPETDLHARAARMPPEPPARPAPARPSREDTLFTRDQPPDEPRGEDPAFGGQDRAPEVPAWEDHPVTRARAAAPPPEPFDPPAEPAQPQRRNIMFSSHRRDKNRAVLREDSSADQSVPRADDQHRNEKETGSSDPFDRAWPQPGRMRQDTRQETSPISNDGSSSQPADSEAPEPVRERFQLPRRADTSSVTVVKSGVVDSMAYSLYSDGSIEAQMPEGMVRFASIDELRAHLDQRN
jgi:hypothetical protein